MSLDLHERLIPLRLPRLLLRFTEGRAITRATMLTTGRMDVNLSAVLTVAKCPSHSGPALDPVPLRASDRGPPPSPSVSAGDMPRWYATPTRTIGTRRVLLVPHRGGSWLRSCILFNQ